MNTEFGALANRWLNNRANRFDPETMRIYRMFMSEFAEHVGDVDVADIDVFDVEEWMAKPKRDGTPYQPNSLNTRMKPIRGFFNWAVDLGLIDRSPARTIGQAAVPDEEPQGLTQDEVTRLLWVSDFRDRTIILVGLHLGLRREEISLMEVQHWTRDDNMFHVKRGKGKKYRVIPVADECQMALETWIDLGLDGRRRGPLWPSVHHSSGRLQKGNISRIVKVRAAQAQVEATAHTLRHTCGTDLSAAGVPQAVIQAWLGHKDIRTTGRYTVPRHYAIYANVRSYLPTGVDLPYGVDGGVVA